MAGIGLVTSTDEKTLIFRLIHGGRVIDRIEVEHLHMGKESDLEKEGEFRVAQLLTKVHEERKNG